jgi:predicted RND superfamily exporter protein
MATIHKKFEHYFSQVTRWVYDNKYLALTVVVLMTMTLATQTTKLTIDTRDESFFHDDDPTLMAYNRFRDTFGQDDTFIIAMKPKQGLTRDFLEVLFRFHRELESAVPYLDEVTSLVNARIVRANGDTLIVEDLMRAPPKTDAELGRILKLIDRYPLYENLLISKERDITSILIKAQAVIDISGQDPMAGFDTDKLPAAGTTTYLSNDQNMEINEAIHKVAAKYQNRNIDFYFTGTPAFVAEIQKGIIKDIRFMVPLSFMVITIFLLLLFRRLTGLIYPVVTVGLSLVSSLGIMALAGIPISNAIQILPTFLIVVGIGDSVHILTIFYRNYATMGEKRRAIIEAAAFAGLPVLMTSITTAFGLLSFAWADVAIIAQLGYVAPVGVMLAFFYTIILLPALIAIFPVKRLKSVRRRYSLPDRWFDAIARTTTSRPVMVALVSACIVAGATYSALSIKFSHNSLTWLPKEAPIRKSTEFLDRINGGTVMLDVTIDAGKANAMHDPDLLQRIDQATAFIPELTSHHIRAGKATSLADVIKETNRALNEDRDLAYAVPVTRELIAQEFLLFESSGSDDLEEITDSSYQISRLSILAPFADAILYKDYVDQVEAYLHRQFPDERVTLTGHMVIFVQMIKRFITSMAKSYVIALVVITILMILMIGRFGVGLMSMAANITPVVCVFGIMGMAGIPLDMATILIGSIVLGLVVDDTIHFLHHFKKAHDKTMDVEAAVRETLHTTGRALVITSMVLCGGFFIYTGSFLSSNIRFGWLAGSAVLLALAADFFLVPALLTLAYGKLTTQKSKAHDGFQGRNVIEGERVIFTSKLGSNRCK